MQMGSIQQTAMFNRKELEDSVIARYGYSSTYEALNTQANKTPEKTVFQYFLNGDCFDSSRIPFRYRALDWFLSIRGNRLANPYEEVSYEALMASVNRTANLLHAVGIVEKDSVAIILPNFIETITCIFAAETVGIACPVNPLLEPGIIANILTETNAKALITLGPVPRSDHWDKILKACELAPGVERIITLKSRSGMPGHIHYEDEIGKYNNRSLDFRVEKSPDSVAAYYHTGGTTGVPKIVSISHGNKIFSADTLSAMTGIGDGDAGLLTLPMFHVNASVNCFAAAAKGSRTVIAGPMGFRTEGVDQRFFSIATHFNITYFSAVPTIYSALLSRNSEVKNHHSIRLTISGAAALNPDTARRFVEKTGIPIIEGYGQTEATVGSTLNPVSGEQKSGSVGKAFPQTEVMIGQLEGYRLIRKMPENEVGSILVRGPHVCGGYLRPEHDRELWAEDANGTRWMITGDLGRLDSEQYLWLTGRSKDLIIRGGHNIDPHIIEDVLNTHPAVALSAAVGRPDAYAGEVPVAYVTLNQGAGVGDGELEGYCLSHIQEQAANPKFIRILDEMPLTQIGKINKRQLLWAEIEQLVRDLLPDQKDDKIRYSMTLDQNPRAGDRLMIEIQAEGLNTREENELARETAQQLKHFTFSYCIRVNGRSVSVSGEHLKIIQ